jgi:hypothetical protein
MGPKFDCQNRIKVSLQNRKPNFNLFWVVTIASHLSVCRWIQYLDIVTFLNIFRPTKYLGFRRYRVKQFVSLNEVT